MWRRERAKQLERGASLPGQQRKLEPASGNGVLLVGNLKPRILGEHRSEASRKVVVLIVRAVLVVGRVVLTRGRCRKFVSWRMSMVLVQAMKAVRAADSVCSW